MSENQPLLILFGSQSGNAEDLAAKAAKQGKSFGLEGIVKGMDEIEMGDLPNYQRVLIYCSTWGEGDMPDNAEDLWQVAQSDDAPKLPTCNFAICSLGDSSYEFFCQSGIDWDVWFEKQGANRLLTRLDCDVDYEKPSADFTTEVLAHFAAVDSNGAYDQSKVEEAKAMAASGGPAAGKPAAPVESDAPSAAVGEGELGELMAGDRDLHILFGSQSGNSESLCAKFAKRASDYGLIGHVHDMDGFDISSMSGMKRVLIVCSTWGEGDMPDNAEELYQAALGAGKILSNTHFSVCALGDTSYEFYCESGKQWDEVLEKMGATRIHDRVDCDVDYDVPAAAWMEEVLAKIACVDDSGTFQSDLLEAMTAHAAGDGAAGTSGDVAIIAQPEIQMTVSIFRYDSLTGETGTDAWACAVPGHHSILNLLRSLKATQDGSLTFRDGAANDPTTGVCVNGRLVLPGLTRICDVVRDKGEGAVLRIEPLSAYEVIRDLVVDFSSYENLRVGTKPWFIGGEREGAFASGTLVGTMDAVVASELHASSDIESPQILHATSDAVPYNPSYMGPAMISHLWNRSCDPRISDKSRSAILECLAAEDGVKAETDMVSIRRHGSRGLVAAESVLQAKTAVLSHDGYGGRHGKHVWWYTWSIKSSGKVNETTLYRTVLGPMGLVNNLVSGVSARMIFGFTRTGRPMINELLAFVAPPAGIGKMPKQFNSRVDDHHQVVSIFNEMDGRF